MDVLQFSFLLSYLLILYYTSLLGVSGHVHSFSTLFSNRIYECTFFSHSAEYLFHLFSTLSNLSSPYVSNTTSQMILVFSFRYHSTLYICFNVIYNNLFKIKDNLNNNLFNFFKNRLLLNKLPFLITNDILKICSASTFLEGKKAVKPNQWGLMGNRGQAQAQEARQALLARHALLARQELAQVEEAMSPRAQHQQESSIFNFEYYLYKMSLSYLEKVFLY